MAQQKRHAAVKSSTAEATDIGILAPSGYRWLTLRSFPNSVGIGPATDRTPTLPLSNTILPWDLSLVGELNTGTSYAVFYNTTTTPGTWMKGATFTLNKNLSASTRQVVWVVNFANGAATGSGANLIANPA